MFRRVQNALREILCHAGGLWKSPKVLISLRVAAPLVSIILPTRDRLALLPRAVASLQAQTETNFEALVVDNSSEGAPRVTPESVPGLADPRFRVVRAAGVHNAASARNVGLGLASAEWVTFLDDDDSYRPGKIAQQLALARASGSPLVLCGACVHLRGRQRLRHCGPDRMAEDELLNEAGLGTPFLFHRRAAGVRFDEALAAGEDQHYGQSLIAHFDLRAVPVVAEPLVDVYQDGAVRPRTNLHAAASWRAARRLWWEFGYRYSAQARRLFVLRARMAHAKLRGDARAVLQGVPALLRAGGIREWRFAANAFFVSAGWMRGRWLT